MRYLVMNELKLNYRVTYVHAYVCMYISVNKELAFTGIYGSL